MRQNVQQLLRVLTQIINGSGLSAYWLLVFHTAIRGRLIFIEPSRASALIWSPCAA